MEIRKSDLCGAYITFGEEELLEDYFLDEKDFAQRHHVGRYADEDEMFLQIGPVRALVNAHTAYHLYQLFDGLREEYQAAQAQIENVLGTAGFPRKGEQYRIGMIAPQQWQEILYFARNHDCFTGEPDLAWSIFQNSWSSDRLALSPHVKDERSQGILAELTVELSEQQAEMLDLFWKPGWRIDKASMEGFDNAVKWRADYTWDWVKEKLIPKAHVFYQENNPQAGYFRRLLHRFFRKM